MTASLPRLDELIEHTRQLHPAASPLERVRDAVDVAAEVNELTDNLVGHFIDEARTAGASWAAVGEYLGLSRQAVQKRYGPEPEADKRHRPGLFSRMTPDNLHVITHAQDEARKRQSDVIGVAHLLLGLVAEPESAGAQALARCGASPDTVTAAINGRIGLPKGKARTDKAPFTPNAKAVLERSRREALRLHQEQIDTDHLVLACLAGPGGLVPDLLHNLGVTYDKLRETIDPQRN